MNERTVTDIIQLLPDNIANQIAAGEVIQRPASAVKELLENAVDANATQIQLIIQDAGKSLVQVIDNGKGMSETDARMSFERHATSKIKVIDDLFHIKTMGFRGEALASIAAVAQVELKTKRAEDDLGIYLEIENSIVKKQELCACAEGTNICMKNVFFNVPARRNFLKSNAVEMRHITDEFTRVALAFPKIFFSLVSNAQQMFHLEPGSLKQRILQLFGSHYNSKLITVKEDTDYMNVAGFAGKPETARKTRGEQFFFINNRFIKSAYLNHAVMNAFDEMIAKDSFPLYILFIDLDPARIDINVHPTKQEIKFEDERVIYAFVKAAVKHALAQFSIAPPLDFTLNAAIQQLEAVSQPFTRQTEELAASTSLFETFTQKNQAHFIEPNQKSELGHWKDFFTEFKKEPAANDTFQPEELLETGQIFTVQNNSKYSISPEAVLYQVQNTYIVAQQAGGFILLHQQLAHERILYDRYTAAANGKKMPAQQSLFPATLELNAPDTQLLNDLLPDLQMLGYQVEAFGNNTFIIRGTPADILNSNDVNAIELLIEQFKYFSNDIRFSKREKLVRCMARQHSIKAGKNLTQTEMHSIAEQLFACATPNVTATGNPTYLEFTGDYLEKMFGR